MLNKNFMLYINYCKYQKKLDDKTLKAYRIDITQFLTYLTKVNSLPLTRSTIENYIMYLSQNFKAATIKRKYAAIRR